MRSSNGSLFPAGAVEGAGRREPRKIAESDHVGRGMWWMTVSPLSPRQAANDKTTSIITAAPRSETLMRTFEIFALTSLVSSNGEDFAPENDLMYVIPEEAEALLDSILAPYGQDPRWYFDKLNFGRPPAPWALACLSREYLIAGHIATSRPAGAGIGFTQYQSVPSPIPPDFVPVVGVLLFANKEGLLHALDCSPVFRFACEGLRIALMMAGTG